MEVVAALPIELPRDWKLVCFDSHAEQDIALSSDGAVLRVGCFSTQKPALKPPFRDASLRSDPLLSAGQVLFETGWSDADPVRSITSVAASGVSITFVETARGWYTIYQASGPAARHP